jgi:eukaryotic-like serine/threonine-protein kinase
MSLSAKNEWIYLFGPFVLDPVQRTLTCNATPIPLVPKAIDLLCYLTENPDRVLSKDELLTAVWPGRVVEESNLSQTVFTLRKALEAGGEKTNVIVTAPGRGYRFTGSVHAVARHIYETRPQHNNVTGLVAANSPELLADKVGLHAPEEVPLTAATSNSAKGSRTPLKWSLGIVTIAVTVALAIGFGVTTTKRSSPEPGSVSAQSIVVLADFQNLTGDPVFDKALHKALEIDLSQSPYLNVMSDDQTRDTLKLMTRPADVAIDLGLAREICARNRGTAAVMGTIAQIGQKYLLTLEARACDSGSGLVEKKAEVPTKDAILAALDHLSTDVRAKLGEPPQSVATYDAPLLQERTKSLEALKAYSDAVYLYTHGKRTESVALFQHAIELDENFAAAYSALAGVYQSLHENDLAKASISKAYALREGTSERVKLDIVARYNKILTHDMNQTLATLRVRVTTYPLDASAWSNLSDTENWLGHFAAAITAGERGRALEDNKEGAYVVLARAYMHSNRFDEARTTCAQAVAKGLAGDDLRGLLIELAYVTHDEAAIQAQVAWSKAQPAESSRIQLDIARIAYAKGQVAQGDILFDQLAELFKRQGGGNYVTAPRARDLNDMGYADRARTLLESLPPGYDSPDYRFVLAEVGNAQQAIALEDKNLHEWPADTLLSSSWAPQTRAALSLRDGRPQEAVDALNVAAPFELRTYEVPFLRGSAYLASNNGAAAGAEFRKILANPGVDPLSPLYPLAQLGLARAERLSGDKTASRNDYEKFLAVWKNADENLPALSEGRQEYAAMN